MGLVLVLAHGLPGVAGGEPPSKVWMDSQVEARLAADERLTTLSEFGELSPALTRRALQAGKRRRAAARTARRGPYVRDFRKVAFREAQRAGIRRPRLFVRQMAAESGFQPCARSGAGALGIAQIMPTTASSWHVDPMIPEAALRAAARHMARYERQYNSYRIALAAYNAGPGAVLAYGGVPPYSETQEYIRRVMDPTYPLRGMTQVFRLPGHMQPGFRTRLRALQRDVRRSGGHLRVTDGWRSYDDQVRLWKYARRKYGGVDRARMWAAPPGCSNHGRGWAADLGGDLGLAHQLAGRHGLAFPMSHEPWHVELAGIPTQSG